MSSILISEFITSQALETLRSKHAVVYEPELYKDRPALIAALQNIEALIVRNLTQVNEDILVGAPKLKVVGRLGVGLENIELPAFPHGNQHRKNGLGVIKKNGYCWQGIYLPRA